MKLLKRIRNFLFRSTDKPIDKFVDGKSSDESSDKISRFNKVAPDLFGPGLKELGYAPGKIENHEHNGFLWSTHHLYENKKLNLTIDVQQAPYYTDYGFSIFIFSEERQESKLLCNIPGELQDKEDHFLISISKKFFTHSGVISLLKGESWNFVNPIQIS